MLIKIGLRPSKFKKLSYLCSVISRNELKYVRQLEQKKWRRREEVFVAEGPKVVGELLRTGFVARAIYATDAWHTEGVACRRVSDEELRRLSFLQHPQQVLALFPLPQSPDIGLRLDVRTLTLALDGVQDPGNLGTIIRLADWFGIDTILCSDDTADAWNPKVVQATMGSIARVNIVYTNLPELLSHLPADVPVYGTFLDGEPLGKHPLTQGGLLVMGNEGKGISDALRPYIGHPILIPNYPDGRATADSLNVAIATAIMCHEFRRTPNP